MNYIDFDSVLSENLNVFLLKFMSFYALLGIIYSLVFFLLFQFYEKNTRNTYSVPLYAYLKILKIQSQKPNRIYFILLKDSVLTFLVVGSLGVVSFFIVYPLLKNEIKEIDLMNYFLNTFYLLNFGILVLVTLFSWSRNKHIKYLFFNFLIAFTINLGLVLILFQGVENNLSIFISNAKGFVYIAGVMALVQFFFPKIFTRGRNKKIVGHTTAGVPLTEQETSQEDAEKESEQWENDNN